MTDSAFCVQLCFYCVGTVFGIIVILKGKLFSNQTLSSVALWIKI